MPITSLKAANKRGSVTEGNWDKNEPSVLNNRSSMFFFRTFYKNIWPCERIAQIPLGPWNGLMQARGRNALTVSFTVNPPLSNLYPLQSYVLPQGNHYSEFVLTLHTWNYTVYIFFCFWLLSLDVILVRFTCIVAYCYYLLIFCMAWCHANKPHSSTDVNLNNF